MVVVAFPKEIHWTNGKYGDSEFLGTKILLKFSIITLDMEYLVKKSTLRHYEGKQFMTSFQFFSSESRPCHKVAKSFYRELHIIRFGFQK